jgi:hypothetical protein
MRIVFAKTRYQYDSYTDLWDLVSLSGFPICYVDEMHLGDSRIIYITAPMNGEIRSWNDTTRAGKRAKVYLWNLERPSGSGDIGEYIVSNRQLIEQGYIDKVLVSDRQLAKDTGFHYVPLGSHLDLGIPGVFRYKRYDIVHLMCYSNRRGSPWFKDPGVLREQVDGLTIAPNGWGDIKRNSLQYSRLMLNVHQDSYKYIEPLRFSLAAAYALPIVTETCHDFYPYAEGVFMADKDTIVETIKTVLRSYPAIHHAGWLMRDKFCRNKTFRSCLEEAIL